MNRRPGLGFAGWLGCLALALVFPHIVSTAYYVSTALLVLQYVALAVAFDLVVGRIGALSLAQPVFYGFGAYMAALIAKGSLPIGGGAMVEFALAAAGGALLALAIGIPSFRLSLHSFAMGTLGFALIGQLVASNWMDVTRGPLCLSAIPPLTLHFGVGEFRMADLGQAYYVILLLAALSVGVVGLIARSPLGLGFTAVRDDPVLAAARGLAPNPLRLTAFAISGALSAAVGVFAAHFQTVVCPTQMDISITVLLLIMVFIGGRGSLRGVVTGAVLFTVLPEVLRLTASLRLVIFAVLLLVTITMFPDGIEHLYRLAGRLGRGRRSVASVAQ